MSEVIIRKDDGIEIYVSKIAELGWQLSDPCPLCGLPLFKKDGGRACAVCCFEETEMLIPLREQFISMGWLPPCEGRKIIEGILEPRLRATWFRFVEKDRVHLRNIGAWIERLETDMPIRLIIDPLLEEEGGKL